MGLRVRHGILIILFLILFSLAGCSSSSSPPVSQENPVPKTTAAPGASQVAGTAPIQDITVRNPPRVTLEDALTALTAAEKEGAIDTRGMILHQVFGYNVDAAGQAGTWVLGMRRDGTTRLLEYTEGEWKELDLPIALSAGEVKVNEIKSPQDIFRQHAKTIVSEMNRFGTGECDLTLDQETYQVTTHSASGSSTLTISAKTGELIPSA